MGAHLVNGTFQSDKYRGCPAGKVPLSVKDPAAQPLLWEYAQRRRVGSHGSKEADAEFADDLETALRNAGFVPPAANVYEPRHVTLELAGGVSIRLPWEVVLRAVAANYVGSPYLVPKLFYASTDGVLVTCTRIECPHDGCVSPTGIEACGAYAHSVDGVRCCLFCDKPIAEGGPECSPE